MSREAGLYYGGDVAAPVFSAVASGALRLMSVAPDDLDAHHARQLRGRFPVSARMPLDELLAGIAPAPRVPVAGLTLDSRAVATGDAFVALKGGQPPRSRACG